MVGHTGTSWYFFLVFRNKKLACSQNEQFLSIFFSAFHQKPYLSILLLMSIFQWEQIELNRIPFQLLYGPDHFKTFSLKRFEV